MCRWQSVGASLWYNDNAQVESEEESVPALMELM